MEGPHSGKADWVDARFLEELHPKVTTPWVERRTRLRAARCGDAGVCGSKNGNRDRKRTGS
jgi:hypothetical protein